MNKLFFENSFLKLKKYCEKENFKGWDPYDGLNSKVIKILKLDRIRLFRLIWIQLFKRNPINLRKLFLVSKGYNAKGIGLFLTAYCNIYRSQELSGNDSLGSQNDIKDRINHLAKLLISLQSEGYSGACWGYNFDWQSIAFFLPENTPTVVATSFAAESLIDAYECTHNMTYLKCAISSADFVLKDLNRIKKNNNLFMFSYSPIDKQAVYNATLLGSRLLSRIYYYSKDENHKNAAKISVKAVVQKQKDNGAFLHSDQVGDKWRDNFHTGFKLESIAVYMKNCNDFSFSDSLEKGFKYWTENFFLANGVAKYYDDRTYPIDLHCAAQSISTIYKLNKSAEYKELAERVIDWTINNMQSSKGYFYFQKTPKMLNKIAYLRWPNAWMLYGMSYLLLIQKENGKN